MKRFETDMEETKKYLQKQVNPILEKLIVQLIKDRPAAPAKFMQEWLIREGPELQRKLDARVKNRPEGLASTSGSEGEEDEVDELPLTIETRHHRPRQSVSAEVYGEYNKQDNFVAPVFAKSASQKANIISKISCNFLFSSLKPKDKETIADAMEIKTVTAGTTVITQGENGDHLFVVDEGTLECFKAGEEGLLHLTSYKTGDAFGELALLYNAPRAASVKATSDCTLFSLDRPTFTHLVKGSMAERRKLLMSFIDKIELFDTLRETEKEKICDCFKSLSYDDGEYLIRESEIGDTFFCLQKGACAAFKRNHKTGENEKVFSYKENDYFGELALLQNAPRAASVVAVGAVEVACIDRASFKRLFGPLEEILKRNTKRYQAYAGKL